MNKRNFLITGLPHSGKSTLLYKVLDKVDHKQGFITLEVLENNNRTGFKLLTANGTDFLLSSVDLETKYKVSKYNVQLENLNKVVEQVRDYTAIDLLYIDEIGQMQLYSESFKELVEQYMNSDNIFIATISKVYSNDFTSKLLYRDDIEVIEITPSNREQVYNQLIELLK